MCRRTFLNKCNKGRCFFIATQVVVLLLICSSCKTSGSSQKLAACVVEARKFTTELCINMPEVDAIAILKSKGLVDRVPGIGDSFQWYHYFLLSDENQLVLEIAPVSIQPDGKWINGILKACYVYDKQGRFVSIDLKASSQRPTPTGSESG